MTTQHTPGPWRVRKEWSGDGYEIYPTRAGKPPEFGQWAAIATVDSIVSKGESARKNARLIAAAPELLECLQEMISEVRWWESEHECCAGKSDGKIQKAMTVIAKATGVSNG